MANHRCPPQETGPSAKPEKRGTGPAGSGRHVARVPVLWSKITSGPQSDTPHCRPASRSQSFVTCGSTNSKRDLRLINGLLALLHAACAGESYAVFVPPPASDLARYRNAPRRLRRILQRQRRSRPSKSKKTVALHPDEAESLRRKRAGCALDSPPPFPSRLGSRFAPAPARRGTMLP